MNTARGYKRLAIAVCGLWLATWIAVGAYAAWQQGIWSDIFVDESRRGVSISALASANDQAQHYADLVETALLGGLATIPISILFVVGWWVFSGFVRKDN